MHTVPRFGNLDLGVFTALPMEHQMHFVTFEKRDNLRNDGAQNAFACFRCCGRMVPGALQVRAKC